MKALYHQGSGSPIEVDARPIKGTELFDVYLNDELVVSRVPKAPSDQAPAGTVSVGEAPKAAKSAKAAPKAKAPDAKSLPAIGVVEGDDADEDEETDDEGDNANADGDLDPAK